jgi:hypothetical protein
MWYGARKGESSGGIKSRVQQGGRLIAGRPCEGLSARFEDEGT